MTIPYEHLAAGVAEIVPPNGLKQKLAEAAKEKRQLVVKFGCDPTAPDLHLGHAVVFRKLRQFQDAGHKIVIIIGDYTTLIGDPSGRNATRPTLTIDEIKANAQTYFDQVGKVVDLNKVDVRYNSEWLSKLGFADMIKLAAQATAAQILQREDFANRMANEVPISLHELLYPLVQAYDSYAIKADIEFGGTDQLFNNMMGRHLQERWGQNGQIVMVMPLLRGLDGIDKMSKSKNNYIGITEAPNDMYGKAMSIPDALLTEWATLATDWQDNERKAALADVTVNPMTTKKAIAHNIVRQYHGVDAADQAAQHFYNNVQNRDVLAKDYERVLIRSAFKNFVKSDEDSSVIHLSFGSRQDFDDYISADSESAGMKFPLLLICRVLEPSMTGGDLKRLIAGGGVAVNGDKVENPQATLTLPVKLKIGKRGLYEVV